MTGMEKEPPENALLFSRLVVGRKTGKTDAEIAEHLGVDSPTEMYRRLSTRYPICPVCGELEVRADHCARLKGQDRRRESIGSPIKLPAAESASPLFKTPSTSS